MTGQVVLGVGASHSTLMNTNWDDVVHTDRAERFRQSLYDARDAVRASGADSVVLVGSNHFRGFWLDLVPAFTLGVGECVASGESGTPGGPQRVDIALARHMAQSLVDEEFDVAFSAKLQIDHGQSHAIQYVLDGLDLPVVPIVVNVFAPPLPSLRRCDALGAAVRRAVASFEDDRRVVVVGSGGLSHRLPFPDWRAPEGEDQEFLVEAWLEGRESWRDYEVRRRQIVRAATASINDAFDEDFLEQLAEGTVDRTLEHTSQSLEAVAGNGAQELRTWLVMAAALGHAPARRLSYEPMPEWLTGMAVALLEPTDTTAGATA